jgi:hypothetical protein
MLDILDDGPYIIPINNGGQTMSRNRNIANNGTFPQAVIEAATSETGICPLCKIRRATDFDHIRKWEWGGTNTLENCAHICSKCHSVKSWKESKATSPELQDKVAEIWERKLKTPKGKARTIKQSTVENNIKIIRRINKLSMQFRQAKTENAKFQIKRKIAKLHRENKAA